MIESGRFAICSPDEPYDGALLPLRLHPSTLAANGWEPGQRAFLRLVTPDRVAGQRVLDFGAGNGILAIAAALVGAAHVVAVEYQPELVALCAENVALNGLDIDVLPRVPDGEAYDVAFVNIGSMQGVTACLEQARPTELFASLGPGEDWPDATLVNAVSDQLSIVSWRP